MIHKWECTYRTIGDGMCYADHSLYFRHACPYTNACEFEKAICGCYYPYSMTSKPQDDQTIKADAGKPKLTLVPQQIIFDIARVREYGLAKYGTSESWKDVDIQRYRDAAYRHFLAYLKDPQGVDEESGLPHLSHLACNIAFLCEMEKKNTDIHKEDK